MPRPVDLSVVMPAYNEEASIDRAIDDMLPMIEASIGRERRTGE